MMDPLSVAASIAGLASAAAQITTTLSSLADAPRLARSVVGETKALTVIFSQLNGFLRGTMYPKRERMSMTTVEQFVAILTHCVLTFAELEEELDGLGFEDHSDGMKMWDRVRWAAKQDTLREILADLQQQKSSLNLLIGIWNCKTNMEAADKYAQLCVSINGILERGQSRRASMIPDAATQLEANAEFNFRRNKRSFSMDSSRRSSMLSVVSLDQVEDSRRFLYPCTHPRSTIRDNTSSSSSLHLLVHEHGQSLLVFCSEG
ncbi:hypothetical protein K440DRAFT_631159, partial [Wilcoxina mikolae CBS 423.85]